MTNQRLSPYSQGLACGLNGWSGKYGLERFKDDPDALAEFNRGMREGRESALDVGMKPHERGKGWGKGRVPR